MGCKSIHCVYKIESSPPHTAIGDLCADQYADPRLHSRGEAGRHV